MDKNYYFSGFVTTCFACSVKPYEVILFYYGWFGTWVNVDTISGKL